MNYCTAYARWAGVGPYYAMFPLAFVEHVVKHYTEPAQAILDPFAGRASSIFAGATLGRPSIGIEINPVGWMYGKTKLNPASEEDVKARLTEIVEASRHASVSLPRPYHEFFSLCYSKRSLRFLATAREQLDWRRSTVDRTLMTLILIDLHGTRNRSFSNQMRQSKAMAPDYSVKWWREHKSCPPEVDPQEFLEKKIRWRYAKGTPESNHSTVWLGDSSQLIGDIEDWLRRNNHKPIRLLFTSPPYIGISDYHRDQWLRLWMLGNEATVLRNKERYKNAFGSSKIYRDMLSRVFDCAAQMMSRKGHVYVRTDAREETFDITYDVLRTAFPNWSITVRSRPYARQTQTALYGDKSKKLGEKDIILKGPQV